MPAPFTSSDQGSQVAQLLAAVIRQAAVHVLAVPTRTSKWLCHLEVPLLTSRYNRGHGQRISSNGSAKLSGLAMINHTSRPVAQTMLVDFLTTFPNWLAGVKVVNMGVKRQSMQCWDAWKQLFFYSNEHILGSMWQLA